MFLLKLPGSYIYYPSSLQLWSFVNFDSRLPRVYNLNSKRYQDRVGKTHDKMFQAGEGAGLGGIGDG
ncbi:MAG: hypothetical protein JXN59_13545, partial [Anaerolineae bacterium]|nr:hypothetical protein [Anaerolineae bacterium]